MNILSIEYIFYLGFFFYRLIILDPNAKVELVRERVKMVLVARSDLKMGAGKLGAQCGHAAVDVVIKVQPPSPFYPLFVEWVCYFLSIRKRRNSISI